MDLYFNDLRVPQVITYNAERRTRNSAPEYNAKRRYDHRSCQQEIYADGLSGQTGRNARPAAVFTQTAAAFFAVTFYSALYGEIQREFHLADEPMEIDYIHTDNVCYKATKLVLEEK